MTTTQATTTTEPTTVYYIALSAIGRAQVVGASSNLGAAYLATCVDAAPAGAHRLFSTHHEAAAVVALLEDIRIFGEFC